MALDMAREELWKAFEDDNSVSNSSAKPPCDSPKSEILTIESKQWIAFQHTNDESTPFDSDPNWQDFSECSLTSHSGCVKTVAEASNGFINPQSSFSNPSVSSSSSSSSLTTEVAVFNTCFLTTPPHSITDTPSSLTHYSNSRFLTSLHKHALSVSDWSHNTLMEHFQSKTGEIGDCLEASSSSESEIARLCLSDSESFDWGKEVAQGAEEKVSFSPELFSYSRFIPLDSPVQLEFDKDKAVLGLSMLTETDLAMMRDELVSKVQKLSNELITALQIRDMVVVESDTKNKFIAALLKVQNRRHTLQQQQQQQHNTSNNSLKERVRPRSLSRSLEWVKRRSVHIEDKSNDLTLHVVVPYRVNPSGVWNTSLLKQWTKILLAMSEGSADLPGLLSTYLQTQMEGTG